jgi:hypothetical protein
MGALRFLKVLMIVMIVLVVAALGVVGYYFMTARVSIAECSVNGANAADEADQFTEIKTEVSQDTFQGTIFNTDALGEAADYAFITYTVRISNQCLIPIDMIEIQVTPGTGDVLQIGDTTVHSLDARSKGDLTATILTARDSNSIRELVVTYYVWGVSFSINYRAA